MNTTSNNLRSRWGYHPAEYATYEKLRALHKWYWQSLYDFHRWHRWWRRQPENRRGPEPRYCEAFAEDRAWYKPVAPHGIPGYQLYPKTVVDHGVLALYQQVRHPQAEPVAALDAAALAQIDALHNRVAAWFAR